MSSKNSLFKGKFGGNMAQNSHLEDVIPGEGKSQLGYVLITSVHACVQHKYSSAPYIQALMSVLSELEVLQVMKNAVST